MPELGTTAAKREALDSARVAGTHRHSVMVMKSVLQQTSVFSYIYFYIFVFEMKSLIPLRMKEHSTNC